MRMSHNKPESYPATNADAADLILFSFVLTCAIIVGGAVLFHGAKHVLARFRAPAFKAEYELTATHGEDEDDAAQLAKENAELARALLRAKRYFRALTTVALLAMAAGIYLGSRCINFGLARQMVKNHDQV